MFGRDTDANELKGKIKEYQNLLNDAENHEEDFIEYIQIKLDATMGELQEVLDTDEEGVQAYLNDEEEVEYESDESDESDEEDDEGEDEDETKELDDDGNPIDKKVNENYNAAELTEVLILIKNGQIKKVFEEIKTKDNVTFLDVAKVLVEKNKPEYLLRLLEMAVYNGYLKI